MSTPSVAQSPATVLVAAVHGLKSVKPRSGCAVTITPYEIRVARADRKHETRRYLAAIRAQCPLECARERGMGGVSYYRLPRRWWEAA